MSAFFSRVPIFVLLSRGWRFAAGYRLAMVGYFLLFVLAQASALAEPYLIGQILNSLQTGVDVWGNVSFYLLLYFAMEMSFWLFHGPGRVIERYVAYHIRASYKAHLFEAVTRMPIKWHRAHHSGESIDKINRAANSLAQFFDNSFEVSYMLLRLIGAHAFLFAFMPYAGWVAAATTVFAFVVLALFDRYLYRQYDALNAFENAVAAAVHDYVTNISSVITLRLEGRVLNEVRQRLGTALPLFTRNITVHEIKWFINTTMIATMITAVLYHYARGVLAAGGTLLGGSFFTLFEYLRRIGESFYDFASLYGTIVRQAADVRGADSIACGASPARCARAAGLDACWRSIEISGLCFRYEDEEHRVHHLEDVAIRLERGQAIALVGQSGSGKSTLLSLLRGLQSPQGVIVRCDGLTQPAGLLVLSGCTTLVPQDPEIFANTIRFNITFGLDVPDGELLRCINLARFQSVLERLPRGLSTDIAEKGVSLSGGEKQRLALARGIHFARDSSIVLFDEPTSSVDTQNERAIYENLIRQFRGQCLVSAVHSLHLLEMFDYIYVLDDGRVVEKGTLQALIEKGGLLASLWSCYFADKEMAERRISAH